MNEQTPDVFDKAMDAIELGYHTTFVGCLVGKLQAILSDDIFSLAVLEAQKFTLEKMVKDKEKENSEIKSKLKHKREKEREEQPEK